jgi:UDP-3-O-[3-hydroxymyristoyl] glucosamine N-acyltransferase
VKVSELARQLGLPVEGDGDVEVLRAAPIDGAGPGDLSFVYEPLWATKAAATKASALVLAPGIVATHVPVIRAPEARLAFFQAVGILHPRVRPPAGIHPTAVVSPTAKIGAGTSIGALVFIGDGVEIGTGCEIQPHVVIHRDARLGDDCLIHSRVSIREGCRLGSRVIIQDGAVIGGDGFGFAKRPDGRQHKIPHNGIVVIEDDVEIQANTCIDRATLGETRICRGAKIDNLVQVAHNCVVGENAILCAEVGLSGSVTLGKDVMLAGQVGIADHVTLGDGVLALAQCGILRNVAAGAIVAGSPEMDRRTYQRFMLAIPRLLEMLRNTKDSERRITALEGDTKSPPAQ